MNASKKGELKTREALVTAAYEAAYPDPLIARAGDTLRVAREDDEFPGWLWCVAANGDAGWVPEEYLDRDGAAAQLRRDYDATELTVRAGERLTLLEAVNGWWWAVRADGARGWVPARNVRLESG